MPSFAERFRDRTQEVFGAERFSKNNGRDGLPRLLIYGQTRLGLSVAASRGYAPEEPRVGNLGHFAISVEGQNDGPTEYLIDAGSRWVRWPSLHAYASGGLGRTSISLDYLGQETYLHLPSDPQQHALFAGELVTARNLELDLQDAAEATYLQNMRTAS